MADLCKTFDCIPYDLKLFRIDHSKTTVIRLLKRIHNYLWLSTESYKTDVLLGIKIVHKSKFDNYLFKKTGQKLNALARIVPFMNINKNRNIMNVFIESQFGYCPLLWISIVQE